MKIARYGVILAAGKGTRMKSEDPTHNKVVYPMLGKPVVNYVIDAVIPLKLNETIVVTGCGAEQTEKVLEGNVEVVRQPKPIGTGDAVKQASPILLGKKGTTIILYGDTPLITSVTLAKMVKKHEKEHNALTILSSIFENPIGYNRIVREEKTEKVLGINEVKEKVRDEYSYYEIDGGVYVFDNELLFEYISKLHPDKDHGEYSLISIAKMLVDDGHPVGTFIAEDQQEIYSINDRFQLAYAAKVIRKRVNHDLMMSGVSIEDPDTVYISPDVKIGQDTIVHPNTTISGHSVIGHSNRLGPNSYFENVRIGNGNTISFSHIVDSDIKDNNAIGPFARIRGGSVIEGDSRIGNFVELKNAHYELGVKSAHLTYIGDANVGEKTNIGCMTVTANYDGFNKMHTEIGKHSFIGSGTILVAPVTVGENGFTAAGSTITKPVLEDEMAIERTKQVNIPHGSSVFLAKAKLKKESGGK